MYVGRLVIKVQIAGHWKVTKTSDLQDTTTKMTVTKMPSSTAIATVATKKAIKKLTAGSNSRTTQITQKKNTHL